MDEFTDLKFDDEKTPEQKIAENNAKIAELKIRKAKLEMKRGQIDPERLEQMRVAANRARGGDASFAQQYFSQEEARKMQAESKKSEQDYRDYEKLRTAQSDIKSIERQIGELDVELENKSMPKGERAKLLNTRQNLIEERDEIHERFPETIARRIQAPPGLDESLDRLKEKLADITRRDYSDAEMEALEDEALKYQEDNPQETGVAELLRDISEAKKRSKEERARGYAKKVKEGNDAFAKLGRDKNRAREYDKIMAGKSYSFSVDGKTYTKDAKGNFVR